MIKAQGNHGKEGERMQEIKMELSITNTDEILEVAKRLEQISKELTVIGYKLQAKTALKVKQPKADT